MRPGHICDASPVANIVEEKNLPSRRKDGLAEAMLVANRWSLQVFKLSIALKFEVLISKTSSFSVISGRVVKEPSGKL
jgi:hypothetical protein